MFLVGRIATVEGVFFDVEDRAYLAVTLVDDPATEFCQWHGRFFYFSPDEVEPVATITCLFTIRERCGQSSDGERGNGEKESASLGVWKRY